MKKYKIGEIVFPVVTKIEKYGAFTTIDKNYKGLIHISEINGEYINDINKHFKVGKKISARIRGIDEKNKRLNLTLIDIDERTDYKTENDLKETEIGFKNLKKKLPEWIKIKENEINSHKIKKN